jgi:hypothetical protein
MFKIQFSDEADKQMNELENSPHLIKRLNAVNKVLACLETNPRHPGLHTHKNCSIKINLKEEIFQSYAQNQTPGAYRIFWHYGPGKKMITILAITPHP